MDRKRLAAFEAMWQAHPASLVFARIADRYLDLDEIEKAREICLKGMEHHPSYATGYFLLGKCYVAEQEIEKAKEAFERALDIDPDYIAAYHYLAKLSEELGDTSTTLEYLKHLVLIDPLDSTVADEVKRLAGAGETDLVHNKGEMEVATHPFPDLEVRDSNGDKSSLYGDTEESSMLASLTADVLEHSTTSGVVPLPERGKEIERKGKRSTGGGMIGNHKVTKLFEEIETDATAPTREVIESSVTFPSVHGEIATVTLAEVYAAQGLLERSAEILELLLAQHPEDQHLAARLEDIRGSIT
jgi:tetratricopeptide (TPR) repeat protein